MTTLAPAAQNQRLEFVLRLADNCLILSQRLGEWCGHGPELEEDMALTNIALDLNGQAQNWLEYAAELEGRQRIRTCSRSFEMLASSGTVFCSNSPTRISPTRWLVNSTLMPGTI